MLDVVDVVLVAAAVDAAFAGAAVVVLDVVAAWLHCLNSLSVLGRG